MANLIQEAPWKIPFAPSGNGPYAVKVKLYDLLFNASNNGAAWYLTNGAGFNLPHDIILFDPAAYASSGGGTISPNPNGVDNSAARIDHGIYLTKITYDARAKSSWVSNPFYAKLQSVGDPHNGDRGYYIYDPNAALPPLELDYSIATTTLNKTYYDTSLPIAAFTDTYTYNGQVYNMCYASSATLGVSGLPAGITSALILSSPDLALQATIPGSSLQPYTRICLRADPTNSEIISILRFFTNYGFDGNTQIPGSLITDLVDPTKNTYLQNIEVWVRCSFFADYITPVSFEQNLTTNSQVAHENLILGQGDFLRFTRNNQSIDAPYIPLTPPRNDVLHIIAIANASPFPIPPVTGTYAAATTTSNNPAGWVNPELELENGITTVPAGLLAIPLVGNAYVSGRIFSPTIDELWIYIKKLVDGQGTGAAISTPTEPTLTLTGGVGDPITSDGTIFVAAPTSFTFVADPVIQNIANILIAGPNAPGYPGNSTNTYISYRPLSPPSPRTNPYSLREIEYAFNNISYNLQTLTAFFGANMVGTGNTNPAIADVAGTGVGTLFELHRSYNVTNPLSASCIWSVANTYSAADITTAAGTNYGSILPSAIDYNASTDFVAGDVYLAADGQWHYIFDHVRLPVLAETY